MLLSFGVTVRIMKLVLQVIANLDNMYVALIIPKLNIYLCGDTVYMYRLASPPKTQANSFQ